jgi:hypothetical protein
MGRIEFLKVKIGAEQWMIVPKGNILFIEDLDKESVRYGKYEAVLYLIKEGIRQDVYIKDSVNDLWGDLIQMKNME